MIGAALLGGVRGEDWGVLERREDTDLGQAGDERDSPSLTLPPGATEILLPDPTLPGKAGSYACSAEPIEGSVILRRHLRLDAYRFPARAYPALQSWTRSVAAADARSIVLSLP